MTPKFVTLSSEPPGSITGALPAPVRRTTPCNESNPRTCRPGAIPVWFPVFHFPIKCSLGPPNQMKSSYVGHPTAHHLHFLENPYTSSVTFRHPCDVSVPLAGAVSIRTGFPSIPFQNPLYFEFPFPSKKAESDLSPSNFRLAISDPYVSPARHLTFIFQSWSRAPIVTNLGCVRGQYHTDNEQTQSVEGII